MLDALVVEYKHQLKMVYLDLEMPKWIFPLKQLQFNNKNSVSLNCGISFMLLRTSNLMK